MLRLLRLWRVGGQDLRFLWFALRHPDRPMWLLPVTLAIAFYGLEPLNFAIPALGVVDDLVILPLVLHALLKLLPGHIRTGFDDRAAVVN